MWWGSMLALLQPCLLSTPWCQSCSWCGDDDRQQHVQKPPTPNRNHQGNGAAFLNLSLLSADLWSAVARCLFFNGFPSVSAVVCFAIAVVVTGSGLVLYTVSGVADEAPQSDLSLERTGP